MNPFLDVFDFHKKFKQPCPGRFEEPNEEWKKFRKERILEEAQELCEAIDSGNLTKIIRESVDVVYVALGTLVAYGLPFWRCWGVVHKANMAKTQPPPGEKPLKPEGWISPDGEIDEIIKEVLARR